MQIIIIEIFKVAKGLSAVSWSRFFHRTDGGDDDDVQFFSRLRSEDWPHHGRSFSVFISVLCHSG